MTEEEKTTDNSNVQANDNSTAVNKIDIGGSVGRDFIVGGTHTTNVYNNATPEQIEALVLENVKIDIQNFEPETILILAGSFSMGFEAGEGIKDYDTPQHQVTLPAYRIGKYPITNSQYYEFVQDDDGPVNSEMNWVGRTVPEGFEETPLMGVTLDDARRYCEWLNKKTGRIYVRYTLPNEAQLEKAYQNNHCSNGVALFYQWTRTLWGAKGFRPDSKYLYPWKNDLRNNLNANGQIRRVVCMYPERGIRQRSGEFPGDVGFPGARHGFRIVLSRE